MRRNKKNKNHETGGHRRQSLISCPLRHNKSHLWRQFAVG